MGKRQRACRCVAWWRIRKGEGGRFKETIEKGEQAGGTEGDKSEGLAISAESFESRRWRRPRSVQ